MMELLTPNPPEDFDAFWATAKAEVRAAPLDYHRSLSNDFSLPGFKIESLHFRGIKGNTLNGWLAYPPEARRLPAFLWIPPYGRESLLPNAYGTRPGCTSMSFNFHGEGAFHQEKYVPLRGYFADGVADPEPWVFRAMAQNAMLAARVLEAQPEADEDRISAMGMSQGAGLGIWLGGLSPIIKSVCADMPFLTGTRYILSRNAYRYPLKELLDFAETIPMGMDRLLYTLSYFDTLNMATRCAVPTHMSLGLKDPACRPEMVQACFEHLASSQKVLRQYPGGHDWDPQMVQNNLDWILSTS